MPAAIDNLMESASQALAQLNYTQCESRCLEALSQARDQQDWVIYQRVLLPLQEARRQKRQAALDGPVRLGVSKRADDLSQLVPEGGSGCLVLTDCSDALDASNISAAAGDCFEMLYADNAIDAAVWKIVSTRNAVYSVEVPAPDPGWLDQWLTDLKPKHWFMRASEALGDAALASVTAPLGSVERVRDLQHALDSADDHELLHQALANAAKALHEATR